MTPCRFFVALGLFFVLEATAAGPISKPVPGSEEEHDYSFSTVIRETTGNRVVAFDPENALHTNLLGRIKVAAIAAARSARKSGIATSRPNEAGNAMENYVLQALRSSGLDAHRPTTRSGRKQAAGYPDVEIDSTPICYLELKTFSSRTATSSQRTFYFSPSTDSKITHDGLHLLLAFEMKRIPAGDHSNWVPTQFKIISLHNLTVHLKVEYNQSNRGLYTPDQILAEGRTP